MKISCTGLGLAMVVVALGGSLAAACVPDTVVVADGSGGTNTGGNSLGGAGAGASLGGGGGCETQCCAPADCPTPQEDCVEAACDQGTCATVDATPGKVVAQQVDGDCLQIVCALGGSKMTKNDDADIPDDGNDCTIESCSAGTPVTAVAAAGDACVTGGGVVCDGAGSCVQCVADAQCNEAEKPSCVGHICVSPSCGDGAKNGDETAVDCGGSCQPCDDGQGCLSGLDCGSKVCSGDICQVPTCNDGQKNGAESDVDCGGACGATCAPNAGCNSAADCLGNQCSGAPGFCVPNCADQVKNGQETDVDCGGGTCTACTVGKTCGNQDANCESGAYCAGGTCATKLTNGTGCLGANQCASGACADGVCCGSTCTGTCMACNLAGKVGVCSSILNGQDPANECAGGACNGSGVCKLDNGQACGVGSACLNGICKDGVCCNSSCSGVCAACNLAGSAGSCSNIANGQDPASECSGATTCNGSGACTKLSNGTSCSANIQCSSGFCVDGVCCNTSCAAGCYACSTAANGSVNGTCTPVIPGKTDSSSGCNSPNACNELAVCEEKFCEFFVNSDYGPPKLPVHPGAANYIPDLAAVSTGFNDKISSSKCYGGATVRIYNDKNYVINNGVWDLSGFVPTYHDNQLLDDVGQPFNNLGDNASSLKVF